MFFAPPHSVEREETAESPTSPDHLVLLIDDLFRVELDERPVFRFRSDGTRERLPIGLLGLAAISTELPSEGIVRDLWAEMRSAAGQLLRNPIQRELRGGAFDFSMFIRSLGGRVDVGKLLCSLADNVGQRGSVTAYIREAGSAAADLSMHIPDWVMLRSARWMQHHSFWLRDAQLRSWNPGSVEYWDGQMRREDLISYLSRWCNGGAMNAMTQRSMSHLQEARDLHDFFEKTIRVDAMRDHVHDLINRMLEGTLNKLEWTGEQLRRFDLTTISTLCDTTRGLRNTFEERTGISLDDPDLNPLRAFFESDASSASRATPA